MLIHVSMFMLNFSKLVYNEDSNDYLYICVFRWSEFQWRAVSSTALVGSVWAPETLTVDGVSSTICKCHTRLSTHQTPPCPSMQPVVLHNL